MVDDQIYAITTLPFIIVAMDLGEDDFRYFDGKNLMGVWYCGINDTPDAVLPDNFYLGLVRGLAEHIKNGTSLYIHCAAGVSRSSYVTIGVLMTLLKIGYDDAFTMLHAARY